MVELASITIGDEPGAWERAGFAVSGGVTRIGAVDVHLVGGARRGALGWALPGVTAPIDGLPVVEQPAWAASGPHPNGASLIDHVVIASPDLDRTVDAFTAAGLPARRERTTESYGAPMRQVFCKAGPVILELVGGTEPHPDAAVREKPARFFGLAITVDDLDALASLLGDALGSPKDAVQPGRRIATLRHAALDVSVPIAFMSPPP